MAAEIPFRGETKYSYLCTTTGKYNINKSRARQDFEEDAAAVGGAGICTFEEYIKEIGSAKTLGKLKFDAFGRKLHPDPYKVSNKLQNLQEE